MAAAAAFETAVQVVDEGDAAGQLGVGLRAVPLGVAVPRDHVNMRRKFPVIQPRV